MPAPALPDRATASVAPGSSGGGEHHLRGHAHLTNCIHLRHHHAHAGASGRRRSPTGSSASASAELMRDLLALQRSRSLRDPSTRRSVDSASNNNNSRVAADPDAADHPGRGALKTLLDQLAENPHPKPARRPRRRFKRGAGRRPAPAAAAGAALDRPAAAPRASVNSSSQEAVCGNKYLFGAGGADGGGDELMRQQVSQESRNVCGIPWNWSRIHHRGKSILDMAGRSLSCGLSDPKSASAARRSEAATSAASCGNMNGSRSHPHFPVTARLTFSTSSDSDSLPLLVDGVRGVGGISSSFSGELGIFSKSSDLDSDLASEARSGQKSRGSHRGRHRSLTQKYAPRTFKDVVGQSLVVQALSNAILRKKIGLVYVFYGPHGTGKTSCARVFAKALNCHSAQHPRPCDSCASCIAHNLGKSRSLLEIGPVGNIDLDSIVDILDNVMLSPMPSQHRVFIIDDCNTLPPDTWSVISKVGLVSDDKLVDLLDLALSADTVNTVKTLRDITETGVEPLALMSQLATIITDILAGTYAFSRERVLRKFFKRPS
nr:unnamed protein product [Digitaria exilis]